MRKQKKEQFNPKYEMPNENWVKKETKQKRKDEAVIAANKRAEWEKGKTVTVIKSETQPRLVKLIYK